MLLQALLVGAGLLALPALLVELAKGYVNDSTRVALFSLVPVLAVVFEPYLASHLHSPQRGSLAAALAAIAGTLLIFPAELPRNPASAIACCGVMAAVISIAGANCLAVRIAQDPPTVSLSCFAALATSSGAVLLAFVGLLIEPRPRIAADIDAWAVPDLIALAILFRLMRSMSAVRMTTRFLIAPLIANLIALAFLRPGVQTRAWLGLFLIAGGSAWLLFAPGSRLQDSELKLDLT